MYLYRAPLPQVPSRLVTASAHPIAASQAGLAGHRVTLRWAPPDGGVISTHRGLLWTSSPTRLAMLGYQETEADALVQFGPRRSTGEGCLLHDRFAVPVDGPVTAQARLKNQVLTVGGRIGQTPFLRRLRAPSLRTGRWSVQGKVEGGHANLILGPPDRPPLGARILAVRYQIEQASARPLATGHVALEADLVIEAEWLDHEHRRRATDWTMPLRHLLALPEVAESEILGVDLTVADLRWAPDRPVWALLEVQIARYRTTWLAAGWTSPTWLPAPALIGCHHASFAWTEPMPDLCGQPKTEPLEIPCPYLVSRLLGLDLNTRTLNLLLALKGGGLYLLTMASPWPSPPTTLTAIAHKGYIRFQA